MAGIDLNAVDLSSFTPEEDPESQAAGGIAIEGMDLSDFAPDAGEVAPVQALDTTSEAVSKAVRGFPTRMERRAGGVVAAVGDPSGTFAARAAQMAGKFDKFDPVATFSLASDFASAVVDKYLRKESPAYTKIKDDMAVKGREIIEEADKELRQYQYKADSWEGQLLADFTTAAIDMGPLMAASVVTKSPAAGLTVMAGQVGGDVYADRINQGHSSGRAMMASRAHVLAEVLPEYIPIAAILKRGTPLLKRIINSAMGEGAQEFITSVLQQKYDLEDVEGMSLKEAIKNVDWGQAGYDSLIGIGVGGTYAAVLHPLTKEAENAAPTPEDVEAEKADEKAEPFAAEAVIGEVEDLVPEEAPPVPTEEAYGISEEEALEVAAEEEKAGPLTLSPEDLAHAEEQAGKIAPPEKAEEPVKPPKQSYKGAINAEVDAARTAIIKSGGINWDDAVAEGMDPADMAEHSRGAYPMFRKLGGMSFDEMAETLFQHDYMPEGDTYYANDLVDITSNIMRGENPYSRRANLDLITPVEEAEPDTETVEALFEIDNLAELGARVAEMGVPQQQIDDLLSKQVTDDVVQDELIELARGVEKAPAMAIPEPEAVAEIPIEDRRAEERDDEARREHQMLRESVADLTPEIQEQVIKDLRERVYTDPKTTLRNEAGFLTDFEELSTEEWPTTGAADMDGLGWINDNWGHDAGNEVLKATGSALKKVESDDIKVYHLHGDEFAMRAKTPEAGQAALTQVQEALENATIEVTGLDANKETKTYTLKGLGLTVGVGTNYAEADAAAIESKSEREAAGKRTKKGEPPIGVVEEPAAVEERPDKGIPEPEVAPTDIDAAAHEAATSPENGLPEPTEAQIEAGNYKKGHISWNGLDIAIENPKGSVRSGVDPGGQKWSIEMQAHYGYINRTEGADGDHVDVFIGDNAENAGTVFVIDQVEPKTREFDEHKVVIGPFNKEEAINLYNSNYAKGWSGADAITEMDVDEFKGWLEKGDTKQPASEFASAKRIAELDAKLTGKGIPVTPAAEVTAIPEDLEAVFDEVAAEAPAEVEKPPAAPEVDAKTNVFGKIARWKEKDFKKSPSGALKKMLVGIETPQAWKKTKPQAIEILTKWRDAELKDRLPEPPKYDYQYFNFSNKEGYLRYAITADVVPDKADREAINKISSFFGGTQWGKGDLYAGGKTEDKGWRFDSPGKLESAWEYLTGYRPVVPDQDVLVPKSLQVDETHKASGTFFADKKTAEGIRELSKGGLEKYNEGIEAALIEQMSDEEKGMFVKDEALDPAYFTPEYLDSLYVESRKEQAKIDHAEFMKTWENTLNTQIAKDALKYSITDMNTEEGTNFLYGYKHALANHSRSSLPQEGSFIEGYDAAREWLQTEDGTKFASGKRASKKMQGIGKQLKRYEDQANTFVKLLDQITGDTEVDDVMKTLDKTTSRATVFNPQIPDTASPGTTRFVKKIREAVETFYHNEGGRSEGKARIKRRMKYDSDRIEPLITKATQYVKKISEFSGKFDGVSTVEEAGQALFESLYIKGKEGDGDTMTEFHTEIRHYLDVWDMNRLLPENRSYKSFVEDQYEETPAGSTTKRLMRPRFDRVTRNSFKDHRKGKNITAEGLTEAFGFPSITYGNYVTAQQRQDHTNYAYDAFMDLAEVMGIEPTDISLGGTLHIAFGALGRGRHAAHYSPNHEGVQVINLTNTKGDGSLSHEWFHALDYHLRMAEKGSHGKISSLVGDVMLFLKYKPKDFGAIKKEVEEMLTGRRYWTRSKKNVVYNANLTLDRAIRELSDIVEGKMRDVRWPSGMSKTNFLRQAEGLDQGSPKSYWSSSVELFARAGEAYTFDKMEGEDTYLVTNWVSDGEVGKTTGYRGSPYPKGDERSEMESYYTSLFEKLEWDKTGPKIKEGAKLTNVENMNTLIEELRSLKLQLPQTRKEIDTYFNKQEKVAKKERDKEESEKAADLQAQLADMVDLPDQVDSEDLDAMFDQVADQIEEAAQDKFAEDVEEAEEPPESPRQKLVNRIHEEISNQVTRYVPGEITWRELFFMADAAYGGTQASGAYNVKDAYDAFEAAANKWIAGRPSQYKADSVRGMLTVMEEMKELDSLMPTQTKRTAAQDEFQQFSTPHDYAAAIAWVANLRDRDYVIEPSAGTGNIAELARQSTSQVVVNELDDNRAEYLKMAGYSHVYQENAEQLNNILPKEIKPTVVLMNPPFSATAGRMKGKRDTAVGGEHVIQGLKRLQPGGRLVALVGKGMGMETAKFKQWWSKLQEEYNVRANVLISGAGYRKFGTTFDNRILVIDKTGPQKGEVLQAELESIVDLPEKLETIRNDRIHPAEQYIDQSGVEKTAETGSTGAEPTIPVQPAADDVGVEEQQRRAEAERQAGGAGDVGIPDEGRAGVRQPIPDDGGERGAVTGRERAGQPEPGAGRAGVIDDVARPDDGADGGVPDALSAAEIAKNAAKHGVTGITEALDGLHELFGGKNIKSFPAGFDQEAYAKAKPHFQKSWDEFKAAGKGVSDFFRFLIENFGVGIKEYAIYFVQEQRDAGKETHIVENVEDSSDLEIQATATGQETAEELTDSVFESYAPAVNFEGSKSHPALLVESAAMATVAAPAIVYTPDLPKETIEKGWLSDAQMEAVAMAGQAFGSKLEDGTRRGFLLGDGTGVGKGRTISGVIMDSIRRGQKKAVWVSEKGALFKDAKRDYSGIGGDENIIFSQQDFSAGDDFKMDSGILFTPYSTLRHKGSKKKDGTGTSRVEQIVEWLGKDFDGVIAFDEAHNMGGQGGQTARGAKGQSAQAIAGGELQEAFPNARIMYVSATAATEVSNLGYADRLGLWGMGTSFSTKEDFANEIGAGGVAAMEAVAMSMKAGGSYIARSISYEDVTYGMLEHKVTPDQFNTYNEMAKGWQIILENINAAMLDTGITTESEGKTKVLDGQRKGRILGQLYSAEQRFFNQVLTAMQTPALISSLEKEMEKGHVGVIQLVATGEAQQERAFARMRKEGGDLEDLDLTPKDMIIQYLEKSFPTQQFEQYTDENNKLRARAVFDSEGNPVINADAVKRRDEMLMRIGAMNDIENAMDQILRNFGTDTVAEITGRSRRVVESEGKRIEEKRGEKHAAADMKAFMDGRKKILIFSDKGGTGASYHADLEAKNQAKRIHYLLQPGWRADKALQGFGRTHRSNQKQAPHYFLVTTNIKAQRRFLSSIARRLDQLGALTRGSREASNQGMFSAEFNLETQYSEEALDNLFRDLAGNEIEGVEVKDIEKKMGLAVTDEYGTFVEGGVPNVQRFLNRLLAMEIPEMDVMFDEFFKRLEQALENARANGTLDVGTENVVADEIEKIHEEAVYTNPDTKAETKYVQLKLENKVSYIGFEDMINRTVGNQNPPIFIGKNKRSGRIYAFSDGRTLMDKTGRSVERYRRIGPAADEQIRRDTIGIQGTEEFDKKWDVITDMAKAKELWETDIENLPDTKVTQKHLITGNFIPLWSRLKGSTRIVRVQTTDTNERMLGRLIADKDLDATLRNLGATKKVPKMSPREIAENVLSGQKMLLANEWIIVAKTVSGEPRIEVKGPSLRHHHELQAIGMFEERISYKTRYFIPTGEKTEEVIGKLTKFHPVVDMVAADKPTNYGGYGKFYSTPIEPVFKAVMDQLKQGQVIDRALRLAFMPIGRVDEKGVFQAYKPIKVKKEQLVKTIEALSEDFLSKHPYLESTILKAKHGLIDMYGLSEEYKTLKAGMKSKATALQMEARDFLMEMEKRGMSDKEAEVVHAMLTGEEITDAKWEGLAEDIRQAVIKMGLEAVQYGLITRASFEKNRGAYLHRVYTKHELSGRIGGALNGLMAGKRLKIYGAETKARGMSFKVPMDKLTKLTPEGWFGKKRVKGKVDKNLHNAKFHVFDRMAVVKGEAKGVKPRIVERVYWPADQEVPAKYQAWEDKGVWEVRDATGSKAVLWRDYTKTERAAMGEILDARYILAKTYMLLSQDLAAGEFYHRIAENKAWATKQEPEDPRSWIDGKEGMGVYGVGYLADPEIEWIRVPSTKVPKSNALKWGGLSGMWVRKEIWKDINLVQQMNTPGMWRKLMTQWKMNKALALDTPIPTPSGWTTMGDIKIGDKVFDETGSVCEVLEVKEIRHGRPCYEVAFSDDATIIADEEHFWFVVGRNNTKGKVLTTEQIRSTLTEPSRGDRNHSIPVAGALKLPDIEVPISPYAIGLWLGDGHSKSPRITTGSKAVDEVEKYLADEGIFCGKRVCDKRSSAITFTIDTQPIKQGSAANQFKEALRSLGVFGAKRLPSMYLRSSVAQRLALLQGLMDSDGWITDRGLCGFATSIDGLRDDVMELLRSLGYKPSSCEHIAPSDNLAWRINFQAYSDTSPFRLSEKVSRLRDRPDTRQRSGTRQIISITPVESVPVRCIAVSSDSHLYLAGDGMIPTHNTARSPVVHMNNIISNFLFMDMADVRWRDLAAGLRSYYSRDEHYQNVLKHNGFGGTLVNQELKREILEPILKKLDRRFRQEAMSADKSITGNLHLAWRFWDELTRAIKYADNKMVDAYQAEDEIFRMATYLRRIDLGDDPATAAKIARDQFLDYEISAPWINAARNSVLPFIGYTYRAAPVIAKSLYNRPWKAAKYILVAEVANLLAYSWFPGDDEEEKERAALREDQQGETWLGTPRMMRLHTDRYGDPVFIDVRRFIPASDIFDLNQGQVPFLPAPLQLSGPLQLAAEYSLNKQAFTGDEIYNDTTDTTTDMALNYGGSLWKSWMPSAPWIPQSWYWDKISTAIRSGDPTQLGQAVSSSVGIKIQSIDVEEGIANRQRQLNFELTEINDKAQKLRRQERKGKISEAYFSFKMDLNKTSRERVIAQLRELSEIARK